MAVEDAIVEHKEEQERQRLRAMARRRRNTDDSDGDGDDDDADSRRSSDFVDSGDESRPHSANSDFADAYGMYGGAAFRDGVAADAEPMLLTAPSLTRHASDRDSVGASGSVHRPTSLRRAVSSGSSTGVGAGPGSLSHSVDGGVSGVVEGAVAGGSADDGDVGGGGNDNGNGSSAGAGLEDAAADIAMWEAKLAALLGPVAAESHTEPAGSVVVTRDGLVFAKTPAVAAGKLKLSPPPQVAFPQSQNRNLRGAVFYSPEDKLESRFDGQDGVQDRCGRGRVCGRGCVYSLAELWECVCDDV